MRISKLTAFFVSAAIGTLTLMADKPVISKITDREHGASLQALSDNGLWAVGYGKSLISETNYSFPIFYDVAAGELKRLYTDHEAQSVGRMMACDVTDDGSIVAGQYDGKPALYHTATETWEMLPFDSTNWEGGECSQITPDGRYGLGTLEAYGRIFATVAYWDFTGDSPRAVPLENLPKPISLDGTLNDNYQQIYGTELSTDGRSFTGLVMFSFAGEDWSFIYNVDSKQWMAFGYDVKEIDDKHYSFTRKTYDGYSIGGGQFMHDAPYLIGGAYGAREATYYLDPTDFSITFEEGNSPQGRRDNHGTSYGSQEVSYTARNWIFKTGDYWYDFRDVCRQIWDIDWQNDVTHDDYGLSGTFIAVSDDGLVVVADDYASSPYDSYVVRLPEPLCDVAPRVDLLSSYTVTPVDNSSFGILKEVKVRFDRPIEILGDYNCAQLIDGDGNIVANSINFGYFVDDDRTVMATFRNRRLEAGKTYYVVIPAESVCISGDLDRKNKEIRIRYNGRPNEPVSAVTIAPAPGSQVSRINAASNPVAVTFDAYVTPVENNGGRMMLYRIGEEGQREEICQLSGSVTGNTVSIFPVLEQRLAMGDTYEVVIEANTLTDLSGADPNEEIVITYEGGYRPETSIGDTVFSDDFNAGLNTNTWMLYDGDGLTPSSEMEGWGFSATLPWWVARDDVGNPDMCAVSHSMYSTPGKSDDWLVTQRLYISDATYTLSFKAQSYRNGCDDKLKVIVYASDDVYTALTGSIVDRMRYYGDIVLEETLSPGAAEEKLEGDWADFTIPLEKYEGKNIYVAFLNDNRNESAVFVDDVVVKRDLKMSFVNLTPQTVVAAGEVEVKGILAVESETETYKGYSVKLIDAGGNVVSSLENPDEEMSAGWTLEFAMPEKLEVPVGKVTRYTIDITMGDLNEKSEAGVMNLAIATTKKVVIEEYTGQTCPNCPLGHAALEWIEQDFGDRVIPLALHSYPGDSFTTPMAQSLQESLGLNAAPTARVDRMSVSSPMALSQDGQYFYRDNGVWYDYVAAELSALPPADIEIVGVDFDGENYRVDMEVRYALDMEGLNANILTVICENGLQGVQENNRYTFESPALREWGKDGEYGKAALPFVFDDVVRTWAGTTYNGTGGLLPSSVESGKTYTVSVTVPGVRWIVDNDKTTATVMLIDAETGLVVNADRKDIYYKSGIDAPGADLSDVKVSVAGGMVTITSASDLSAYAYSADGRRICSGRGHGVVAMDLTSCKGLAVIAVTTDAGVKTFKVSL